MIFYFALNSDFYEILFEIKIYVLVIQITLACDFPPTIVTAVQPSPECFRPQQ
jgi:hypothetical protein